VIVAALAVVVVVTVIRAVRRAARGRQAAADRATAEDLLAAFAAELDAGAAPDAALRAAVDAARGADVAPGSAGPGDDLQALALGLGDGADATQVLAECRTTSLRQLGAALVVCRAGGARLAPVARALASQAQAAGQRAGELDAALAGPRSSGRLVAGLPIVGIAFAGLLGARPVHILLGSPVGSACLVVGVLLDLLGLRWLRWAGDRVARRTGTASPGVRAGRWRWVHHPRPAPGRFGRAGDRRRELLVDLPLALELVAACLTAGATVQGALEATAQGIGGPLGVELRTAARALRLGASVDRATARLVAAGVGQPGLLRRALPRLLGTARAGSDTALVAAARALGRVETSGARLADALTRIATRARAQAHDEAIAAARRAGVAAVAPLGLCFLPAFLLIGVVPTIVGALQGVLPPS
jgi:tight adherence protein B